MSYQQQHAAPEGFNNRAPQATMYAQHTSQTQALRNVQTHGGVYPVAGAPTGENGISALIGSFAQTHISVPNGGLQPTGAPIHGNPQFYYTNGQIVYMPPGDVYAAQQVGGTHLSDGTYAYPPAIYAPQTAYPGYMPGYPMMHYPQRQGYLSDRHEVVHREVPALDNRRGSYSTNESTPGTPFYGSLGHRDQGTVIAGTDRSPSYSTPSPGAASVQQAPKPPFRAAVSNAELDALLAIDPAIPPAVPAVFTPRENMRTLEQSLSNPIYGNRNVYIRGLHPDTNDETLAAYAARFGLVETSKAIIDTATGACKGFGFAKYYDVRESELCIRGFYKLGYEVGFARESFNSRLKAKGDPNATNLYVSNLPKDMNETELSAIFNDYTVVSSRILHDNQGNSRGVGFARFETRDICEEIIKKFHGQPIGDEGLLLQVRYADTPAQKDLKKITTERRQFRTTEYNVSAYGSPVDLASISPSVSSPGLAASRVGQITRQIPMRSVNPWTQGGSVTGSGASGGERSVPGSAFKDLDTKTEKMAQTPRTAADVKKEAGASTPSVSDEESVDEHSTIHVSSPTRN